MLKTAVAVVVGTLVLNPVDAAVVPNSLFSPGAVLQRGVEVPVWGTADNGEKVKVKFQGQEAVASTVGGKWMVRLNKLKAGGPYTMTISGQNTVRIPNVLVGEVWVASGQSNMVWPLKSANGAEKAIANSTDSKMRLFTVPREAADTPRRDVKSNWVECTPETVEDFSAVAYFFGRELRKTLGVPVGLINSSVGGTPAAAWTRHEILANDPFLRRILDEHKQAISSYLSEQARYEKTLGESSPRQKTQTKPDNPKTSFKRPSGLYNAMIAPLIPYAFKGVIWYQGEQDGKMGYRYGKLFPAMIRGWRQDWGQGDFPFLFVQIAPFSPKAPEGAWAELREAQRLTSLTVPKTGMAVITDYGTPATVHPEDKEPVGVRLALAARALAYGEHIVYSGPVYKSLKVRGSQAEVSFGGTGGGLIAKNGELTGFTIAGKDGKFVNAEARILGNKVLVSSPDVPNPAAVRFGWLNYPIVNLFNKEGLPASPFRTDSFQLYSYER